MGIEDYNFSLVNAIIFLKDAKRDYKQAKKDHHTLRDKYITGWDHQSTFLYSQWMKEKLWAQWRKFKWFFEKTRMNSISEVEYFYNSLLVRVSSKPDIEKAIIIENAIRFVLAYSSPLL